MMEFMAIIVPTLIVVFGIGIFLFLSWKKKKTRTAELELLLQKMDDLQSDRKHLLLSLLSQSGAINESQAEQSADNLIQAEQDFIRQFIKQQINQSSLTDFYPQLMDFLDQYLYFLLIQPEETSEKDEPEESTNQVEEEASDVSGDEQQALEDDEKFAEEGGSEEQAAIDEQQAVDESSTLEDSLSLDAELSSVADFNISSEENEPDSADSDKSTD